MKEYIDLVKDYRATCKRRLWLQSVVFLVIGIVIGVKYGL